MNEKLKRFSFGEQSTITGRGRGVRSVRPELVLMSIEDRKQNTKVKRVLIVSIHHRLFNSAGWMKGSTIELSLEGNGMSDGILHEAPTGYRMNPTSAKKESRMRILIRVPDGYERFANLRPLSSCSEVECDDGRIAFKMPW